PPPRPQRARPGGRRRGARGRWDDAIPGVRELPRGRRRRRPRVRARPRGRRRHRAPAGAVRRAGEHPGDGGDAGRERRLRRGAATGAAAAVSRRPTDLRALVDGVSGGDTRAVARAITLVENRDPLAYELVRELYPRTGGAAVVGFTGPPGVGKSSLIACVIALLREDGKRVGVVTVDPSSPFSRGALLGDRIRLADHFLDDGVFIRSMSTRGHLGGVSEATLQALLVLDAAGMDVLLLETVGVGQSEVEVASLADTVLLVLQPGSGDSIQALKAGVMEIPDVIVINKSDHPAARTMRSEIRSVLALDPATSRRVPIVETEAFRSEGIAELWEAVLEHRAHLEKEGGLDARRRESVEHEIVSVAVAQARRRLSEALARDPDLRRLLDEVHERKLDPLTATREISERVFRGDSGA